MDFRLSNGKIISLPKDEVVKCDRAEGLAFLADFNGDGEGETVKVKELADYTDAELYDELDKVGVEKARLPRRRDEGTAHTRQYWNDRRKRVAAELKQRGLRVRRQDSRKILPTAAHLAARKREFKEMAA